MNSINRHNPISHEPKYSRESNPITINRGRSSNTNHHSRKLNIPPYTTRKIETHFDSTSNSKNNQPENHTHYDALPKITQNQNLNIKNHPTYENHQSKILNVQSQETHTTGRTHKMANKKPTQFSNPITQIQTIIHKITTQ
jgi:hypothetical protein